MVSLHHCSTGRTRPTSQLFSLSAILLRKTGKPEGYKTWASNTPRIRSLGSFVRSDPRHFRQQSNYTICGNFDQSWQFRQHDEVFNTRRIGQDFLWKFNLPSTERRKILEVLNGYNLNGFSLFDSVESLIETIWLQQAILKTLPLGLG
jgi:hypothetical protein